MGKAIPKNIKVRANYLLKTMPEQFTDDFEKNKIILNKLNLPYSKVELNLINAYILRKIKRKKLP